MKQKRKWMKRMVVAIVFLAIALVSAAYVYQSIIKQRLIAEMDERELGYDADAGLILIDKENGLVGIYAAIKPMGHFWIKTEIPGGVYEAYISDSAMITIYNTESAYQITIPDSEWTQILPQLYALEGMSRWKALSY